MSSLSPHRALASGGSSSEPRPTDAPRMDGSRVVVPDLPLEYVAHEDGGIRFAYHPSAGERVRPIEGRIGAIRGELSAALGRDVLASVEIRIAATPSEMPRLAPMGGMPSHESLAVAFREANLVVVSATAPPSYDLPDVEGAIRHALAHLAFDEALGDHPAPRWLHEGFAVTFADRNTARRAETLTLTALRGNLMGLRVIDEELRGESTAAEAAYAEAADFARRLSRAPNHTRFIELCARMRNEGSFDAAVVAAYGTSLDHLEEAWRKSLTLRYGFLPAVGGLLLTLLLLGAASFAYRARRRRAAAARHMATLLRSAALNRKALIREARRARGDDLPRRPPPDAGVPRVEHAGRWYTLH